MAFDPRTDEGTTKRHVDIGYGTLAVATACLFPPALLVLGGMWLADRNHYPAHNDNTNNQ